MVKPEFTIKTLFSKEEINITDLIKLFRYSIWLNRKIIIFIFSIMSLIGTIKYLLSPVEFESKATIIANSNNSNNLNNFSNLLGINLPNNQIQSNFLGPEMYEDILKSDAFLNEVVIEQIQIDELNKKHVSIEVYLQNTKSPNLLSVLLKRDKLNNTHLTANKYNNSDTGQFKNVKIYQNVFNSITPNLIFTSTFPPVVRIENVRSSMIANIKNRIKLELKDGKYIISVTMGDRYISAITCQVVLKKLIEYITFYKTQKQVDNISFIQKRYEEAKFKYELSQKNLANYKDNSLGMIFQSSQIKEQILSNEMSVAFNIYNQLSVQLEQSKLELKKESPVFSFLEPIKIPEASTSGNYFKKLLLFILIGIGLSLLIVLRTLFKF
jgi:hypothetical protein